MIDFILVIILDRLKFFFDVVNLNEWMIYCMYGVLMLFLFCKCLVLKIVDEYFVWVCYYFVFDICIMDDWLILVIVWVDELQLKRRVVFWCSEGVWQFVWMDLELELDLDVRD